MAEETKTATIKLYRDKVPRITITYKDKKDLFKQFQEKIRELDFPVGELYWGDWDNDRSAVKTADDLFGAVQNCNPVRMFYSPPGDDELLTCPSSDDDEEKEDVAEKNETEARSPSPARRRHRSRSASVPHRAYPFHDQMPWNFAPWQFMMDPRFTPMPLPPYPHPSGKSHRRRRDRSHHCSCERLSKEFSKM
ncbi:hypothetical protein Y032_0030g2203 [Ancylostoma ceylanicum]|uniref:PB1 domain-containing protein n=1 Tax=Ancylostoma ceylanicum TaxID=53326 RepID=A0A016US78_9BILA|nr:hypothetical protein Y032_0030g2203 [Ancylostoma ceylanicum]